VARKLRFEEPNGIYHIGTRGNDGETMFRDEVDHMEWLRLFAKVAVKYRWIGWTYVLMGNHFHFVVQIPHGGLSRGMQELNPVTQCEPTSVTAARDTSSGTAFTRATWRMTRT